MGFMDSAKDKAAEFLGNEQNTDQVLDKAEQLATDKLGEDKAEHIRTAREAIDERIGETSSADSAHGADESNGFDDNPEDEPLTR
ncbi:Rv0909 family putative TA system antitoxin [Corynebacterium alimapuense]|uniref:Antitoxin n=1 Tax=Corynebacterium alimapuense TaxID=1576874 RepID=A0A3M8K5M4_9CORY|nr:Rv0909 family putative TA system antitoxin [Corynebacterium alimapuense]RNE48159.1 antitoxin [Corynebacterium alimapuense]